MIVRPFLEELKDEHKRYFESKLAALALKNQLGQFDSVSKVSGIVLQLLRDNKEIAMLRIDQDPRIQQQLYGLEFYGHLAKLSESMTKEQIYTQLLDSLQNQNTELSCILLIHAIFIHYFYDHFNHESASKKESFVKQYFPTSFLKTVGD
ncbi:MAG: hypothetical protein HWD59_07790 [Coxiellaceae bacterium]|nr:MAG: hypothetical protein HWD59_07790 [Coxiellaceae bacterium]